MKGIALLIVAVIGSLAGSAATAQQTTVPSVDEIVKGLDPARGAQTKSLKGITVIPGQPVAAPSIDLTVNFAYNSATLEPDTLLTLKRLGEALKDPRLTSYSFVIAGHTDARGTAEYNQKLSEARSAAVREHLVMLYEIDPQKLTSVGFGKSQLKNPHEPESAENRRVQITTVITTSAKP